MNPAGPRATTPHGRRTYENLLAAGQALATTEGVEALSISRIADAAGVAKGTFYVHFEDRDDFVNALRISFRDRMREVVSSATKGMPAGRDRLIAGLTAYLDGCLADPAMRALAREMSGSEREGTADGNGFVPLIAKNIRAAGWSDIGPAATLIAAATAKVAAIELEAGRRRPTARRALFYLVR